MESTPGSSDPLRSSFSSAPSSPPTVEELEDRLHQLGGQYQFLETIFALTISALIVMTVGLDIYIFKQMRLARGQAYRQRLLIQPALQSFRTEREPMIRSFVSKLQTFAATNPEFRPILDKYRNQLAEFFIAAPTSAQSSSTSTNAATNVPAAKP